MTVVSVMLPVALVVGAGYLAGRQILDERGVKALADLAFYLFLPCLLFRSMATASFQATDAKLLAVYFGTSLAWFLVVALLSRRAVPEIPGGSAVLGLAAVYSNTVQLGIPIQKLAFGEAGLRMHLAIISLQSLVLLVAATLWIEAARARAARARGQSSHGLGRTLLEVVRAALVHPVIFSIVLGLLWNGTGWPLPAWSEQPLAFLASAAGPLLLVLMGAQLARLSFLRHLRTALVFTAAKNLVHPALVYLVASMAGLPPLATAVAVVCAALPMGANVFLFSQRYRINEDGVMASIALSSLAALVSLSLALAIVSTP
ncbi:MAG: AEC family transporter [Casimicrobiaceae bacterium]|nr:AEC family transporter [Casimicrobiaceae bacterium]MDW8313075.1 AEC family transporter [Burkholderiales bacterium]